MPQQTPRKPRQRQHNRQPSASEYESDAINHLQTHVPPPSRTNTELNLSVLRRYNPLIRNILSIAANAVVYVFTPSTQAWEKSGVEGTLFVCDQVDEQYCMIVLNRRGLENLMLDLGEMEDVERTEELLILRFSEEEEPKVMGIWIHEDKDDTRDTNAGLIQQCWQMAREMKERRQLPGLGVQVGQQINLQDLFRSGR